MTASRARENRLNRLQVRESRRADDEGEEVAAMYDGEKAKVKGVMVEWRAGGLQ